MLSSIVAWMNTKSGRKQHRSSFLAVLTVKSSDDLSLTASECSATERLYLARWPTQQDATAAAVGLLLLKMKTDES